jgi:2-(1,2-epoxy-1,2-dihydrophenyl)acetyl-CoA isomerase
MSLAAGSGGTAVDDTVLVEIGGGVAWVRLNRPDRLNALTYPMMDRILDALTALAEDEAVRAVVLTGVGRAFCAGADTKGMAERRGMDPDDRRQRIEQSSRASLLLHGMGKPTVAAINGAAVGAGLGMALACDLKLMAAGAKLVPGFARIGLSGDYGVSWFTSRQLGAARALRLLMLDEHIDARRAQDLGLVDEVVEDERLKAAAADLAGRLASGPTQAYARMKANLELAAVADLGTVMLQESRHMVDCMATADYAEAIAAFADKRSPNFTGR